MYPEVGSFRRHDFPPKTQLNQQENELKRKNDRIYPKEEIGNKGIKKNFQNFTSRSPAYRSKLTTPGTKNEQTETKISVYAKKQHHILRDTKYTGQQRTKTTKKMKGY